ncbi:MAG: DUF6940 family protein, partial [Gemmataceae bacterium]
MWTAHREEIAGGLRVVLHRDASPVAAADALFLWQTDAGFRSLFNDVLADAPYTAFRWETPPLTARTAARPFEFVLLDAPGLDREPEPDAFAAHFAKGTAPVIDFANLGRDATLIVPRPLADPSAYGHLAAFVRAAPEAQRHALWQRVGEV